MKRMHVVLILLLTLISQINSQNDPKRSCAVTCLNHQWIPETYNAGSRCILDGNSKGLLSVHETGDIKNKGIKKQNHYIEFKVAIYKKAFASMISYSDEIYTAINVDELLQQCVSGDEIVIILVNGNKYSLPHHRIKVGPCLSGNC